MRKNSKEIALSAVACALGTIALTVGTLYSPMLFTGYLFACLCMMLPLSRGYFKGAALCFLAINALTLLFNGFNFFDTLPFTLFFGLHPIVNEWQAKLHGKKSGGTGAAGGSAPNGNSAPKGNSAPAECKTGQAKAEEFVFDFSGETESAADAAARNGAKNAKGEPKEKRIPKKKKFSFTAADGLFLIFKIVWFDFAMYFVWKIVFSAQTAIPFIDRHIFLSIAIGGSLFFIVYDLILFRLRETVNFLIKKYVGKK